MSKQNTARDAIEALMAGYEKLGYVSDEQIATALFLAQKLEKPLLVEGPPGVGKTELAKATAEYLGLNMIRLQCYEGLDEGKALYEWQYGKQLLYTQVLKEKLGDVMQGAKTLDESMTRLGGFEDVFFSEQFLQTRPLLEALRSDDGVVLLIDEIDKSDDEFEAFLLEILSDYQISIPELGTVKAKKPPLVFLTSNNTREIGDALKRRCLHLYIPFPDAVRENTILQARVPQLNEGLRANVVDFVQKLREMDLKKPPAVSETIDWARTVVLLNIDVLDSDFVKNTLNVLLKFKSDIETAESDLPRLIRESLNPKESGAAAE
jgi:MoxR-like ATPase